MCSIKEQSYKLVYSWKNTCKCGVSLWQHWRYSDDPHFELLSVLHFEFSTLKFTEPHKDQMSNLKVFSPSSDARDYLMTLGRYFLEAWYLSSGYWTSKLTEDQTYNLKTSEKCSVPQNLGFDRLWFAFFFAVLKSSTKVNIQRLWDIRVRRSNQKACGVFVVLGRFDDVSLIITGLSKSWNLTPEVKNRKCSWRSLQYKGDLWICLAPVAQVLVWILYTTIQCINRRASLCTKRYQTAVNCSPTVLIMKCADTLKVHCISLIWCVNEMDINK